MFYALAGVAVLGAAPLSSLMDLGRVLRSFVRAGGFTCAMLSNEQQPFLLLAQKPEFEGLVSMSMGCLHLEIFECFHHFAHGNRED